MGRYEVIATRPQPVESVPRVQSSGMATWYMGTTSGFTLSSLPAGIDHQVAAVHYTVPSGGAVYLTGQLSTTTPTDIHIWCGSTEFSTGIKHSADLDSPISERMHVATWSVFTDIPGGTYVSYLYARDDSYTFSVSRISLLALVAATGQVTGEPTVTLRPDPTDQANYYHPPFWFD